MDPGHELRAKLTGLVRRADLNGQSGVVLGPDPRSGKLQMRLDSTRKIVLVVPENLELEGHVRPMIDATSLHLVSDYIAECNKAFGPGSENLVASSDAEEEVEEEVTTPGASSVLFHSPRKHRSLLSVPGVEPAVRAQLVLERLKRYLIPMVRMHSKQLLSRKVRDVAWTTARAMARDGLPVHGPVAGWVLLQGCAVGKDPEQFLDRLAQPSGAWVLHYLQEGVLPAVQRALSRGPAYDEYPTIEMRRLRE